MHMGGIIQLSQLGRPLFRLCHGAEVFLGQTDDEGQENRQNAVEVEAQRLEQDGYGGFLRHADGDQIARHGGKPPAEGEQHAPGGGGGMDQERGLLVRDLQRVVHRTGDRAGDHAAQGAGGKHRQTQTPGKEVGAPLGLDKAPVFYDHIHKAVNAAGNLHQVDHRADDQAGGNDEGIAGGHGLGNGVNSGVDAHKGRKGIEHKRAGENADDQRDKYVFCQQCQRNGENRRHKRPETKLHK